MTGPIREGNCITLPYYISQMVHRMAHIVAHIWMRVAGSTWRGIRWLFGDTFVLTFLSLCLLQEAALAWGAIKSLMKRAEAFSLRLCWKDKRPLKQINVEIENFGCKGKREWRRHERLWFRWLSSRGGGGQRWRGGGETSEGLWLACLFLSFLFCFVSFCCLPVDSCKW